MKNHHLYFLKDNQDRIRYCGITKNPKQRAVRHKWKYPNFSLHVHISNLTKEEALQVEGGFIRALNLQKVGKNISGSKPAVLERTRWTEKGHFVKPFPKPKTLPKKKERSIEHKPEQNTLF